MKKTIYFIFGLLLLSLIFSSDSCDTQTSDEKQTQQQEQILQQGTSVVGMPGIKNFRERKLLKAIYEMRDANLTTYTYVWSDFQGKYRFLGVSVGYGIPYATQFTSPQKYYASGVALPQADPNGLFSPASAEGTWVLLHTPNGDIQPQYIEPRISVFTYRLPENMVLQ